MLSGYKTYIVGSLGVIWALLGLIFGWVESTQAINIILASLGAMGLRAGIKTIAE